MTTSSTFAAALCMTLLACTPGFAQTPPSQPGETGVPVKHIRITYENLTTGQGFSPPAFMTHDGSAPPMFKIGEKASFGLMRLAEEGNPSPLLDEAGKMTGKAVGMAATGLPTPPGKTSRAIEIDVTRVHPMISGAWMLGMTNDGFTGVSAVDAYSPPRSRPGGSASRRINSSRRNSASTTSRADPGPDYIDMP